MFSLWWCGTIPHRGGGKILSTSDRGTTFPQQSQRSATPERDEARKVWPFLTPYDLSTLRTPTQLASMVKDRKGISQDDAVVEVDRWMTGYNARTQTGSLARWENEGGGEPT